MIFVHLGTGTGFGNTVPNIRERERELEILFPTFGNGNGNGIWQPISQNIGKIIGKSETPPKPNIFYEER